MNKDDMNSLFQEMREIKESVVKTESGIVFPKIANYTVDWERLKDEADLLAWVYHLSEKAWFTNDISRRFMELVAETKNFDLHCV